MGKWLNTKNVDQIFFSNEQFKKPTVNFIKNDSLILYYSFCNYILNSSHFWIFTWLVKVQIFEKTTKIWPIFYSFFHIVYWCQNISGRWAFWEYMNFSRIWSSTSMISLSIFKAVQIWPMYLICDFIWTSREFWTVNTQNMYILKAVSSLLDSNLKIISVEASCQAWCSLKIVDDVYVNTLSK